LYPTWLQEYTSLQAFEERNKKKLLGGSFWIADTRKRQYTNMFHTTTSPKPLVLFKNILIKDQEDNGPKWLKKHRAKLVRLSLSFIFKLYLLIVSPPTPKQHNDFGV
jgi:hypothetical protein